MTKYTTPILFVQCLKMSIAEMNNVKYFKEMRYVKQRSIKSIHRWGSERRHTFTPYLSV